YEAERQPITEQVSRFAMDFALQVMKHRRATPPEIEMDSPVGDETRRRIGQEAYDLNVAQYCCGGLNFGYFYDASPIIAYDGEPQPHYTMADFTSSSVPGCRAPHVWLRDGRSLYDALGADYSLLRFDPAADAAGLCGGGRTWQPAADLARYRRRGRPPALRPGAGPGAARPARGLARRCCPGRSRRPDRPRQGRRRGSGPQGRPN